MIECAFGVLGVLGQKKVCVINHDFDLAIDDENMHV